MHCGSLCQSWRVAKALPNMVSEVKFLFCNSTSYTAMFRIMQSSMVKALCFLSQRLPVQNQSMRFCTSGVCARILFKSSEAKPSLSSRHGGLPPRGQLLLLLNLQTCLVLPYSVRSSGTLRKSTFLAFFCQTPAASAVTAQTRIVNVQCLI